jgi:hypothetical protein
MIRTYRSCRVPLLAATVACICFSLSGCELTKISDLNKHPENYSGNEVTIAGIVTSTAAPTNPGTFEMDDGSGRLWVLSSSNVVPPKGTKLAVTGLIQSKSDWGSNSLVTTLQEIRRCESWQACIDRT